MWLGILVFVITCIPFLISFKEWNKMDNNFDKADESAKRLDKSTKKLENFLREEQK